MGVKYEGLGSPLIWPSSNGIFVAGQRCPDIELTFRDGETKRLYSLIDYGKHVVLSVGPQKPKALPWPEVLHKAEFYHIATASETQKGGCEESQGITTVSAPALGDSGEDYVVYMRPDTYVGFVGSAVDCREHLSYLTKAPQK